jgi:hypothetical protein
MTRTTNLRVRCWLATFLFVILAVPATAQVKPDGSEVVVSGAEDLIQTRPDLAARNGGQDGFLMVYEDTTLGVYGRFFSAAGAPGAPALHLVVSDPLPDLPFYGTLKEAAQPAIGMKADSTFLLVWVEVTVHRALDIFVDQRSVLSHRILARRFAANGNPLPGAAGAIKVIAASKSFPTEPAVLATADGSFWITWTESGAARGGIHLRRLNAAGKLSKDTKIAAQGAQDSISSYLGAPQIAAGGDGFLITWAQCCDAEGGEQVFARLFRANGTANGTPFAVSHAAGRSAESPSVAGRAGKEFLIVWQSESYDGSGPSLVRGQFVSPAGALVQSELPLSASKQPEHIGPLVATTTDRNGWFVIWSVLDANKRTKVEGRSFSALGAPVGKVVKLSQGLLSYTHRPMALATAANGRALAAWVGSTPTFEFGIRSRGAKSPVRK